jgi:hypothetical protein
MDIRHIPQIMKLTSVQKKIVFLLLAVTLTACPIIWPDRDYEFEYETIVTGTPVNLEKFNSRFDDYNSDLPYPYGSYGIYYSTNRNSGADNFNIIHRRLEFSYHEKDDVLDVHYGGADLTTYEDKLLDLIYDPYGDELGPFSFYGPEEYSYFFYANDQGGDFDIRFAYHLKSDFGTHDAREIISGPDTLKVINSTEDDLYPVITEDQTRMYFCSNRENDRFNIYSVPLPEAAELHDFLTEGEPVEPQLITALSSDFNDKCPFIFEDIMVFTSDREGGQGGFDLYYSRLVNGAWTDPVNFGPEINTEYNEYRPIIFPFEAISDYLMIFSSDRPGGLGGFDLYIVKAGGFIK